MKSPGLALTLALAIGLAPSATQAEERLLSPALAGFVVAYEAANSRQMIREEVLEGETFERWTAMVTTQRFAIPRASTEQFTESFLNALMQSCPRATHTIPATIRIGGREGVMLSASCPASPATGQRESMTALVVPGEQALHVKQVAFRAGYAGDMGWADGFLRATRLCDEAC